MTSIITLGGFSGSFSGSGVVEGSHALSPTQDLQLLRKLILVIKTTGAHENIRVRLENTATNYVEFDMGGNREGVGETDSITQNLNAVLKNATYVTDGDDFDSTAVSNVRILFTDDGDVSGTASADSSSISLAFDEIATPTIQVCRGFKTELDQSITASSTQVKMKSRPYDKSSGQGLTETAVIISDNEEISVVSGGSEVSLTFGEWFWLEFVSETLGVSTWNIVQRGGGDPAYPPRLRDFKRSLWIDTHEKDSPVIVAIDAGLIEKSLAEAEAMELDEKQKTLVSQLFQYGDEVTLGDHRLYIPITEKYAAHNLVSIWAEVLQEGTTGTNDFEVKQVRKGAAMGTSDTQFDITNPSGTTFRYTYDGTGTDPGIADSDASLRVGDVVNIQAQNFNAANNGYFELTAVGANYFEVTNGSGVAESDKTIGSGSIVPTKARDMLSTKITIDSGERESLTAAAQPVIDTNFDDLQQYDKIRVDVSAVSTTKAKGLIIGAQLQAQ